ncbi:GW domain-containing glycosaminoglycan-binding protein, partial [Listeria cornellensis]|uniref:Autolysin, amidase n=1 Tax=Listeria cornellensis FSL F6-0969 TaxID=1265820 RepID=W7BFY2_9LIST
MRRGNLTAYTNKPLKVHKQITINGTLWYYLINNSELVTWVRASSVTATAYDQIQYNKAMSTTTYAGVKTATGNNVWTVPNGTLGAKVVNPLSSYTGKNLKLIREMKTSKGVWYQFSIDGKTIGWVENKAVTILYTPSMEKPANLTRYVNVPNESVYYFPVADSSMRRGNLTAYTNKPLKVHKQITINGTLWYYLINNSELVTWVRASSVSATKPDQTVYDKTLTAYGKTKTTANQYIWKLVPNTYGINSKIAPLSNYSGKKLRILREAKTTGGLYYQISSNGQLLGWVNASALTKFYDGAIAERPVNLTKKVANTAGVLYSFPVDDPPIKVGTLAKFAGKTLTADRQANIEGKVWYRLKNGNVVIGWTLMANLK